MIVVSDTTPIISLLKAGHLDLLQKLYGSVRIPEAVYQELTTNQAFADEAEQIRSCQFLQRVSVDDEKAVALLRRVTGLDRGESEAIYYADANTADLLLMDEVKGRQVARTMGLRITGTVGMIIAAYEESYLTRDEVLQIVTTLQTSGRHISERLYQIILRRVEDH